MHNKSSATFCVVLQGDYVWLEDPRKARGPSAQVPMGAQVRIADSGKLQLTDDEGKVRTHYGLEEGR